MNALREHVIEKLAHTLDLSKNDTIVVNLEKSILNHVTERVEKPKRPPDHQNTYSVNGVKCGANAGWKTKGFAAWDNPYFVETYKQKYLHLQKNIAANRSLVDAIRAKRISPVDVVDLRPFELQPDGPYAKQMEILIDKELRKQTLQNEAQNIEGFFTCRRCKSKKTSYYELQTRSADEPMTVFVSCLQCGAHWKT